MRADGQLRFEYATSLTLRKKQKTISLNFYYFSDGTAKDCQELKNRGSPSGVYILDLEDGQPNFPVYCDQTTDGGGWIVFQSRISPFALSFNRGWEEYEQGFGDPNGEHWLGNQRLHRLTFTSSKEFRIDLMADGSESGYATFKHFQVNGEDKYRWSMDSFSGNISNSIESSKVQWDLIGAAFSTPDRDNDNNPDGQCSASSGWWLNWCANADLNGASPWWNSWKSPITKSVMKLR